MTMAGQWVGHFNRRLHIVIPMGGWSQDHRGQCEAARRACVPGDAATCKSVFLSRGCAAHTDGAVLQWRAAASYSVTLLILAVSSTGVLYTLAVHDDWRERLPLQAIVHPLLEQIPEMAAEQVPGIIQV